MIPFSKPPLIPQQSGYFEIVVSAFKLEWETVSQWKVVPGWKTLPCSVAYNWAKVSFPPYKLTPRALMTSTASEMTSTALTASFTLCPLDLLWAEADDKVVTTTHLSPIKLLTSAVASPWDKQSSCEGWFPSNYQPREAGKEPRTSSQQRTRHTQVLFIRVINSYHLNNA